MIVIATNCGRKNENEGTVYEDHHQSEDMVVQTRGEAGLITFNHVIIVSALSYSVMMHDEE